MERFDVAIAGAGPAGCRAAWRLAAAGVRVALLDASHPREKPCGGGVTGRALDLVREALDNGTVQSVAIETAAFEYRGAAARMRVSPPGEDSLAIAVMRRRDFDQAVLAAALKAGACLVPARVTGVTPVADGWLVETRDGGVHAGWLLGADGPNSLVRRRVLWPYARTDLSIAAGYFVHGATSREISIAFVDDPPGYLWSFPRPDHLAVGVCGQADATTSAALLSCAARWIGRHVGGSVELERYSWPIPSLRARTLQRDQPAGSRWMLLGDAAGLVDPITREGIFFALTSGDAAAESLLGNGNPAANYTRRVRQSIHTELLRATRLEARFFTPRFTALLISALQRSAPIRDVMSDLIAGRQTYHGLRRRLLRTFEARLLLEYLRSSVLGRT